MGYFENFIAAIQAAFEEHEAHEVDRLAAGLFVSLAIEHTQKGESLFWSEALLAGRSGALLIRGGAIIEWLPLSETVGLAYPQYKLEDALMRQAALWGIDALDMPNFGEIEELPSMYKAASSLRKQWQRAAKKMGEEVAELICHLLNKETLSLDEAGMAATLASEAGLVDIDEEGGEIIVALTVEGVLQAAVLVAWVDKAASIRAEISRIREENGLK